MQEGTSGTLHIVFTPDYPDPNGAWNLAFTCFLREAILDYNCGYLLKHLVFVCVKLMTSPLV